MSEARAPRRVSIRSTDRKARRLRCCAMLVVAATLQELEGVDGIVCGIGPVDAAAATARALAERRPDSVLHVGLAGARGFGEPGLVIGSEALYCDTDSRLVRDRVLPD